MRSANLLNDYAFKYVFGQDNKEANAALKALLSVFLERNVSSVVVKNSELYQNNKDMKSSRLDLLVEFEDGSQVDLEMQARSTDDDFSARLGYYMARIHGSQSLKGMDYDELNASYILAFLNFNMYPQNKQYEHQFQYRDEDGMLMSLEDKTKIIVVEMKKVNMQKKVFEMNAKEKIIYYFLNCQKGMEDTKIKEILEQGGVVSMIEKRVETIGEDQWQKLNEDFEELARNERERRQARRYEKRIKEMQLNLEKMQQNFEQKRQEFEQKSQEFEQKKLDFEQKEQAFEKEKIELLKDNEIAKEQTQKQMYQILLNQGKSIEDIASFYQCDISVIKGILDM